MEPMEKKVPKEGNKALNKPNSRDIARESLSSSERIEALRTRLYERGAAPEMRTRHSLREIQNIESVVRGSAGQSGTVSTNVEVSPIVRETPVRETISQNALLRPQEKPQEPLANTTPMFAKKRRGYRGKLVMLGVAFFLLALGVSSLFLFKGNNLISGENITIDVSGPLTIGGGEELQLQIAISNQNAVPIEAATLIIEYPKGTQSADGVGKELGVIREQLEGIGVGEVINLPARARVFGEENEEKELKVLLEYRVAGSNSTFETKPTILRFKISSSPVVLKVDAVKSISSGQEAEIELTVSSNSPSPLTNILVKATYPETGFDFSSAEPEAISGRDTWLIKELTPGSKKIITIKGIVVGKQDEERVLTFEVGVPSDKNSYSLFSVFTTVQAQIAIEQPFLDLDMNINGDSKETVVLSGSKSANAQVKFKNSLDDTLYDGAVSVELMGSKLGDIKVTAADAFYDSSNHTIVWDSTGVSSLKEIAPGSTNSLAFNLEFPAQSVNIPEITLKVTAKAERVFEDRVPQELIGSITRKIRLESSAMLTSSAVYSDGPFVNSGPTPPVAEKATTYTYLLTLKNGNNDLTGGEVTAVLPQYMTWLDNVTEDDDVTYNAVTRTMTWKIGDVAANERMEAWVQVSFKPSKTQIGITPTILEAQRFKATNKFTSTTIRTEAPALTTALQNDPDEDVRDGRVQEN